MILALNFIYEFQSLERDEVWVWEIVIARETEFAAEIFGTWDGTSHSRSDLFSTLGFIEMLSCSYLTI